MDQNNEMSLPEKFIDELGNVPALPLHLYAGIRRGIDRKRAVLRTVWAAAASLLIMVTAFQAIHLVHPQNIYVPEAAEELTSVNRYFNSEVYTTDENSYAYYEETLYQE
jgi:hypothetical protein